MDVASNSTYDTVTITYNWPKIILVPVLLFADEIKASEMTKNSPVIVVISKKLKQDYKVNQDNIIQSEILAHFPSNIKPGFK